MSILVPRRITAWVLALSILVASCSPGNDDNDKRQKEDEKNERRNSQRHLPMIILAGLRVIYKILKSR